NINRTSLARPDISEGRYRVSLQSRTKFRDDIQGIANVTKLSDAFVLQDFFQGEFQLNPQPDNIVAVTKTNPNYTLTAIGRFQANYYDRTRDLRKPFFPPDPSPLITDLIVPDNTKLCTSGNKLGTVFNRGVQASLKIAPSSDGAQSNALGLDGLNHVLEPFTKF